MQKIRILGAVWVCFVRIIVQCSRRLTIYYFDERKRGHQVKRKAENQKPLKNETIVCLTFWRFRPCPCLPSSLLLSRNSLELRPRQRWFPEKHIQLYSGFIFEHFFILWFLGLGSTPLQAMSETIPDIQGSSQIFRASCCPKIKPVVLCVKNNLAHQSMWSLLQCS